MTVLLSITPLSEPLGIDFTVPINSVPQRIDSSFTVRDDTVVMRVLIITALPDGGASE
jgi:hypothetical protein